MSPTLLEAVVVVIMIIVAWQLGLALAPIVRRELRNLRQSLDEASDTNPAAEDQNSTAQREDVHDPRH